MKKLIVLFLCTSMLACGDNDSGSNESGDSQAILAPEYQTTGVWNLSGPLGGGVTIGDIAADLLVDELVDRAVPSLLQNRARDTVHERLHAPIKAFIDERAPAQLTPGGAAHDGLSSTLSEVQVQTRITLSGQDEITGTERIISMTIPNGDERIQIPLQALARDGEETVVIEAVLSGRMVGNDALELDPHGYDLRYGRLVMWIIEETTDIDLGSEANALSMAVDCSEIAEALGADGLDLEIAGQTVSIGSGPITAGCEAVKETLAEKALGYLTKESGVNVGGDVELADTDEDGVFELTSGEGYGGQFTSLPGPIDLTVQVSFTGEPLDADLAP